MTPQMPTTADLKIAFAEIKRLVSQYQTVQAKVEHKISMINGQPGIMTYIDHQLYHVKTFDFMK
jgi:hypothetical protein